MSLVKQIGLLAAGCQPWNNDVCAASGDRFAYCATLAIYVYQLQRQYNEFQLHSILSEHKKTITAISWHPRCNDLIVSCGADKQIIVWNVNEQSVVARLENAKGTPVSVGWCVHDKDVISFVYGRGPLYIWNFKDGGGLNTHKEATSFGSNVCQFRWHHKKMGKLVFGHLDGTLSFFCPGQKPHKHILRPESSEDSDDDDPIDALEWDPLSTDYLLVVNRRWGVRLVDSTGYNVIMNFQLPTAAATTHTAAWISTAPGMFLTGDTRSGVMRLWNVSKQTPIENIKLKKTGFHALHVFSTAPGFTKNGDISTLVDTAVSSTSASMPAGTTQTRYALPPAHAVCTFMDGGVGLYDLGKRKWDFLRDQGHIETIFDCEFKPDNADLLATASFDGTIKVWDIASMDCVESSLGNEGVIYNISWAPADLNCIAAATSRHGAFIWDIGKGKVSKRFQEHGKAAVYTITWNQKDARRIATGGADNYCVVRQVDGKLVQKYKHPAPVFGCDWSPTNKDMLATGCEDKCVRIYYLATTTDSPLKVFAGHTAKVFHVKWSPLREGLLCSGSDDGTIRIWDYTQESCISVLSGHKLHVRGLLWSTEIPYLLISGSWDFSIRIWDIRDGACIDTVLDHGADVYGLTSHPSRPFVLASCSRDSSVRIWSLTSLVQPLEINVILQKPWTEIIGSVANFHFSTSQGAPPLLTGKTSKDLKLEIEDLKSNAYHKTLRMFSEFFMHPGSTHNLWELISVIKGVDDIMLSHNYSKGIIHVKHLIKFKSSAAQSLELIKMSKYGAGVGSVSREEKLREAAQIHLKVGNIQRYCELMVELGNWERALAMAPGVSMEYWKSLADRHADFLIAEDHEDAFPYCMATGASEKLVKFLTTRGQLQDAVLVAQVAREGILPFRKHHSNGQGDMLVNGVATEASEKSNGLLSSTIEQLAEWYFRLGNPIHAACVHLAHDDCKSAMSKLIRGNVLELAVSAGLTLGNVQELTNEAIALLAMRCENIGKWELAVDLLKLIQNPEPYLAALCARCGGSMSDIDHLHKKAGFPSLEECVQKAESLKSNPDFMECVKYYMLSTTPEVGLDLGLGHVKATMQKSNWTVNEVLPMLQLISCVKTDTLQQHKCAKSRHELLIISAYVGALVAIRRQYESVVEPLMQHALMLLEKNSAEIPFSKMLIKEELEAWKANQNMQKKSLSYASNSNAESNHTFSTLMNKCGQDTSAVGVGPDNVAGSGLPSHFDIHLSYFNGKRIQGAAFFLEDGRSAISINDALMWAKVNHFSPLASGVRINPF